MDGLQNFWQQSDGIGRVVAIILLGLSIATWVTVLWRGWLLRRTLSDIHQATAAFWQAPNLEGARQRLGSLDREQVLVGVVDAALAAPSKGTLASQADGGSQRTRRLREALHSSLTRLQSGQVMLASVGATAPFIGLFGTVWGIYHALLGMATQGSMSIDKIAGPVGEALIMTAAGLAVAIPAVLAYNLFGKWLGEVEAELEGFALDLRDMHGAD